MKYMKILPVFVDVVSFDAVVSRETRCLPTPRDVSTGSICRHFVVVKQFTVLGPIVSRKKVMGCFIDMLILKLKID